MSSLIRTVSRHVVGYGLVLPLIVTGILVQAVLVGPLWGNRSVISKLIFRACGRVFGLRFELDPASAPVAPGGHTMSTFNHLARIDFACLYLFPDAALMMNALFFRMPVFGPIIKLFADSAGIVGTDQTLAGKRRDLEALAQQVQAGRNVVLFPEGIQTDGRRLLRFSPGAAEIFYDPAIRQAHPAVRQMRVQPVVLRVREIEGEEMLLKPEKWDRYTQTQRRSNVFVNMSRRAAVGRVVVEVLICPTLDPADFPSAVELMQAAHEATRVVLVPAQTRAMTRSQWKARIAARDFSV